MKISSRWLLPALPSPDLTKSMAQALNIPDALARLLVQRGVATFEDAKAFFRPQLSHLHNPFLMKDMEAAVERLSAAVDKHEKIMVYGDYDVDGTTAVAMFYSFLRTLTSSVIYCIPDRAIDGYGIAMRSIDFAKDEGVALVVALDCGIKAMEKIDYAASKGIDYIICDHHLPDAALPAACAVLDPQRSDCPYPYKFLSGCGVGFKLMQAYCQKHGMPFETIAPYLDLVAVSIASDIVPITGENRVLAHYGLIQLNTAPRMGLRAIIESADAGAKTIGIGDIVFKIGPRINAAGRMESGARSVDLLLCGDAQQARTIAANINEYNSRRKSVDKSITAQAISMVKADAAWEQRRSIVVYSPHWHKGVVGIVASRLAEEFYRPAVVLTDNGCGWASGSARSIAGFDLYHAVSQCADLLSNYGGHMHAAGLTLPQSSVEVFRDRFEAIARSMLTDEMLVPQIEIDAQIDFAQINEKFYRILRQFAPFGPGNMPPVFVTCGCYAYGAAHAVGNPPVHLRFDLVQRRMASEPLPAIAFGMADYCQSIQSGAAFDVCYSIAENHYNGKSTLQANIKGIKMEN
jgi:single-stranded-DNA-specific exonuclease